MKSKPALSTFPSNSIICLCVIVAPLSVDMKRQRQWSEQKVSDLPPGQTLTPRLLTITICKPLGATLVIDSPRLSGDPFNQSRNTSTPTNSFLVSDRSFTI